MLKKTIQSALIPFNLQLNRIQTIEEKAQSEAKKTLWLRKMEIKTILDIGANTGQFAKRIHEIFPDASLYSFEPIRDCYEELVSNFKGVEKFRAFNLALGNETGKLEIHRSEYSPSSSILPMGTLHKTSFPFTQNEIIEEINVVKLDDLDTEIEIQAPLLIKLDVQGFEDKVIEGGMKIFNRADIIIIELSVEELYNGQKLFDELYGILKKLGFRYQGNYEQLHHPDDGRVLQMDGIFIRNKLTSIQA
jgi:FkbM family methyltransferase